MKQLRYWVFQILKFYSICRSLFETYSASWYSFCISYGVHLGISFILVVDKTGNLQKRVFKAFGKTLLSFIVSSEKEFLAHFVFCLNSSFKKILFKLWTAFTYVLKFCLSVDFIVLVPMSDWQRSQFFEHDLYFFSTALFIIIWYYDFFNVKCQ